MQIPFLKKIRIKLPRRGHTPWRVLLGRVGILLAWCTTLGVIFGLLFVLYAKSKTPDPESIVSRQVKESTKIYDRTGKKLLYEVYNEERRTVVPWEKISDHIKHATLAAENANFYQEKGFDVKGILRSIYVNLTTVSASQGGSTITQQLVGNALVGRQKTLIRKVQELILAVEVEQHFTKDEILAMYLNQVPYGSNAYGVEAASQTYFGIPASDLSIAQAALLASLVQQPSRYSPYGSHVPELMARKEYVLNRMYQLGFITKEQKEQAVSEKLTFLPRSSTVIAPHFALMARDYVNTKYGADAVESGGFKIVTTLDADLQQKAEELVTKYAAINKTKYKATNAALVAIDPRNGEVRALVGSANYYDTANQGNFNVALAKRQPGSSFKPFAYTAAFQKGYTDNTVLWDVKTEFNPLCPPTGLGRKDPNGQDCYHPQNYNGTFIGPVTMRQALALSLNVPAVKTLYLAGINNVIDLASKMGITTLTDRSRLGLSLVLGGAEVRPIDLVSAYGVFANDGVRVPWGFIQSIQSSDGTILEERQENGERVLDSQIARLMSDVLSDNNARAPGFGFNNSLYMPGRPVAAKTGTTQENRDGWVVGYTPSLATVVWTGNNNNTSMTREGAGLSAAGPLWNAFMTAALVNTPVEFFPQPDPVVANKIMLNGSWTSPEHPNPHSILFYVNKNNPLGSIPDQPENDIQYTNWEWAVQNYIIPH